MTSKNLEKDIYGYLIHYTIYFYLTKGRKPKSVKEFYTWFIERFQHKGLITDLLNSKDGNRKLQKILKIWFYKINTKGFNRLINELKQIFQYLRDKNKIKDLKEFNNICKIYIERKFILAIPKRDKRVKHLEKKSNIIFHIKKIQPDIIIGCKEPLNTLLVIELKSGNRKLWRKYRSQLKNYLKFLSLYSEFKNLKHFIGILYYYKSDYLTLIKYDKEKDKFVILEKKKL